MRVARSLEGGEVRIEQVADPDPGPGEVVCDVLACGVCASDVIDWYVADKLPAVLGHEPVGRVRALGEGTIGVTVGDAVAIHHHAPCGECRRCRRGRETMCERFRSTRLHPGGFAEQVRLPPELVGELLPLPDGLDPVTATFVEPLACVLRAQSRCNLRAGDSLLVVGAGVNGLLQIAAAHARAVEAVWVREPRADRLALAQAWGAEHHGNELIDVAIVCTPRPDAIETAARSLAPGGTLLLYAPPHPQTPPRLDATAVFMRELTVTASYAAGAAEMRAALELISSGEVDPSPLISHRLPLDQTAHALDLQRRGEALKVVVMPSVGR
jgi:L-iditol 2-dehydrogenase